MVEDALLDIGFSRRAIDPCRVRCSAKSRGGVASLSELVDFAGAQELVPPSRLRTSIAP